MAETVHCYNKGCGQKFDPNNNQEGKKKNQNVSDQSLGKGGSDKI